MPDIDTKELRRMMDEAHECGAGATTREYADYLSALDEAAPTLLSEAEEAKRLREELAALRAAPATEPVAAGEDIMVNTSDDVYTLPLEPTGLTTGPRFVVHVPDPPAPVADGITAEIAAERRRQIEVEGWTPERDDEHRNGEMARVAATYAYVATLPEVSREYVSGCYSVETHSVMRELWPRSWSRKWWKPKDRRRDLVRACALLTAEIERLDRLPAAPTEAGR